jgi:hypothetical protein
VVNISPSQILTRINESIYPACPGKHEISLTGVAPEDGTGLKFFVGKQCSGFKRGDLAKEPIAL